MWVLFVIEGLISIGLVAYLLHTYASWKNTPWYAYIVTALGWFMALSPVFLVPADIAQALDVDVADREVLGWIWKIVYWVCFFLTWYVWHRRFCLSASVRGCRAVGGRGKQ